MRILLEFIIFPGFLFTAIIGMIVSWIDRKVTALVQWRQGPPFLQPFYDFVKLLTKEVVIPEAANKYVFLLSPFFAISTTTLVSIILWKAILVPQTLFVGDLLVVIYLLAITPVAVILGASASGNPIASLAASREMKMFLSYELPFLLAILVSVIKLNTIKLGEIVAYQQAQGIVFSSLSGAIAFIIFIIVIQAKLGLIPFDIAEAEQELAGGVFIEYSGILLAMHKLNHLMLLFVLPVFAVILFLGGIKFEGWSILWGILKYVIILVLMILIRNTNPRIRIDQAVRFFWRGCLVVSIFAVILALIGY
ncbi:MAG: NADH-quinone oxidoreductase subunit H [Elusimicrobia bacterium]|nr:NADH-quinone oxidoreductase subunit H [Elusimicrobiota bacterium]